MGPEGLPVLLILFKGGCHISILRSHFVYFLEGVQGQGECGLRARRKVVQGQGQCGGFKGKCWGN